MPSDHHPRSDQSPEPSHHVRVGSTDPPVATDSTPGKYYLRPERSGDDEMVLDLLADEYTRNILGALNPEPLSASDLADQLEMSRATIYRRLNQLKDYGLVATKSAVSPSGNQYTVFEVVVQGLTVDLAGGSPTVTVDIRTDTDGSVDETAAAVAD